MCWYPYDMQHVKRHLARRVRMLVESTSNLVDALFTLALPIGLTRSLAKYNDLFPPGVLRLTVASTTTMTKMLQIVRRSSLLCFRSGND